MIDITPVINACIALVAALITAFLIPWIKTKVGNEKLAKLLTLVKIGVGAAEQIYDAEHGKEKKEYVLKYLADRGYKLDDSIENAIEAAVLELHNALR